MNYKGVIIEESLGEKSVLNKVKIVETKVEKVTERHKTPWLRQWTFHAVEVPEEKGESIAEKISKAFDTRHQNSWYVDYKNDKFHFIIFPNKIFKIDLQNPTLYKEIKEYGILLGIPEYQLKI